MASLSHHHHHPTSSSLHQKKKEENERQLTLLQDIVAHVAREETEAVIAKCLLLLTTGEKASSIGGDNHHPTPTQRGGGGGGALALREEAWNPTLMGAGNESLQVAVLQLLFQSWIQRGQYSQLVQWIQRHQVPTKVLELIQPLVYYAKYRLQQQQPNVDASTAEDSQKSTAPPTTTTSSSTTTSYQQIIHPLQQQYQQDIRSLNVMEQHLLAQSLVHAGQTKKALEVYQQLLIDITTRTTTTSHPSNTETVAEQTMELLTNALYVLSSNAIPGIQNVPDGALSLVQQTLDWMEKHQQQQQQQPCSYYDLCFNLGTFLTLAGGSNGVAGAGNGNGDGNANANGDTNNSNPSPSYYFDLAEQACRQEFLDKPFEQLELELAPIVINRTWSRHWNGLPISLVDYTKPAEIKSLSVPTKQIAKINQDLLTTMTKSTTTTTTTTTTTVPLDLSKWTPLQIRLYWYNRAVQQLRNGQYEDCQQSCTMLQATWMEPTKSQLKKHAINPTATSTTAASTTTSTTTTTPATNTITYIPTLSKEATYWWQTKCTVLLAHVAFQRGNTDHAFQLLQAQMDVLQTWIRQQNKETTSASSSSSSSSSTTMTTSVLPTIVDHAMTHLQLHQFALKHHTVQATVEEMINLLQGLPPSIQSTKAVVATVHALQNKLAAGNNNNNNNNKNKNQTNRQDDEQVSPKDAAQQAFWKGHYSDVIQILDAYLPTNRKDCTMDQQMLIGMYLIPSLAHVDPRRAIQVWEEDLKQQQQKQKQSPLLVDTNLEESFFSKVAILNGEALEQEELPRSTSSSKDMSPWAANSQKEESTKKKKKSMEQIRKRRAKKRDGYIQQLQDKGMYNPKIKPKDDRWMPKYARRRRGGHGQHHQFNNNSNNNTASKKSNPMMQPYHRGAQGGGTLSEQEIQKLDAAARKVGLVQTNNPSNAPSTANMKVVSDSSIGPRKGGRRR